VIREPILTNQYLPTKLEGAADVVVVSAAMASPVMHNEHYLQ
jgi:hypothetical protein